MWWEKVVCILIFTTRSIILGRWIFFELFWNSFFNSHSCIIFVSDCKSAEKQLHPVIYLSNLGEKGACMELLKRRFIFDFFGSVLAEPIRCADVKCNYNKRYGFSCDFNAEQNMRYSLNLYRENCIHYDNVHIQTRCIPGWKHSLAEIFFEVWKTSTC